jgi:hypothetical protein
VDQVIQGVGTTVKTTPRTHDTRWQAYQILHWGFVVLPAIAGIDKFFHLVTDWDQYLAPQIERILPFSGRTFMMIVGVVELLAAGLVAWKPRIGAWVVAAWLTGITIDLVIARGYWDIALRDVGLVIAAVALARLAAAYDLKRRPA